MGLARSEVVLKITDVSQDPSAPARARIRSEWLAQARAAGFEHRAWTATTVTEESGLARPEPTDDDVIFGAAMIHRDGRSILSLSRWTRLDDASVQTLFEDGTIVCTARKPDAGWWKLRWGLAGAPEHAYDLAYFDARSVNELVALHEARVAAHRALGRRPMENHDLRTCFAIRKRWREIADPRMKRQQKIAMHIALVVLLATLVGGALAARAFGQGLLAAYPAMGLVAAVMATVLALAAAWGAFVGALYFVAPILARTASAPETRKARDLLALADSVPRGWLPDPSRARAGARRTAARPADEATTMVRVSPVELMRLQRLDLVLGVASTLVLPVLSFAGTALFGTAAIPTVLGVMFTVDGAIALFTKKTRVQLLRERFVPALVRAEGESACPTAACATPLGKKVLGFAWLLGGLASLYSARIAVLAGSKPAPAWLVAEWGAIAVVAAFFAFTTAKKRHKRLVAA